MSPVECPREADVLDALLAQRIGVADARGSEAAVEPLRAHLLQCTTCQEVARVAAALREDRESSARELSLPEASQVWWRATMRARLEATHDAARPLTWAHGVAAAAAAGLVAGTAGTAWPVIERVFAWSAARLSAMAPPAPELPDLMALSATGNVLLACGVAFVILAPLALYFALADE